jgi:hypothetical protein
MAAPSHRPPSQRQYVPQGVPEFIDFQHPRLVPEPPDGQAWIHEIKFDGYRLQVRVSGGAVTVRTRNRHDLTGRFPEIAAEAYLEPNGLGGNYSPPRTTLHHPEQTFLSLNGHGLCLKPEGRRRPAEAL